MASIGNDEQASSGVMSGHDRKTLSLSDAGATPAATRLRWVLSIGEALPPSLAQAWFERHPGISLLNIYGPAECADNVACHALHSIEDARSHAALPSVPIGRPTANLQLFVLDERLQPVPQGIPGEICVAGEGVGRGYLNDPQTTAHVFIGHPFKPGARFYRTGDIGRIRADGAIDYLGRSDHQVKVRGQRIEPGEVETRLQQHPGIRDAAVVGAMDARGQVQLVAYWVAAPGAGADVDTLRHHLGEALPSAMVPARWVRLDALPLNANGKIDRKSLAARKDTDPDPSTADSEPLATPTEKRLGPLWQEVLACGAVAATDNFFHIGGHSLLATRLMSRVREVFHADLPLRTIFESPTPRQLARRIDALAPTGPHDSPALRPLRRDEPLPLSATQQRLWFFDRLEPGSALYNMPCALELTGALDAEAAYAALNDVVARHEPLRTTFHTVGGETVQRIATEASVPFVVIDLSTLAAPLREAEARRLAALEAAQPFDLGTAPMLRARLLRLEAHTHWLLLTLPHIAADGGSLGVLRREWGACYRARSTGTPARLPGLPIQYADIAAWQAERLQGASHLAQLAHWRSQLEGAPALLDLPTDRPRPATPSHRGDRVSIDIDADTAASLRRLGRRTQTTLFMVLSSAFAVLLGRWSGQADVCLGTPAANRPCREAEDLIGPFVNTLVLRFRLGDATPFEELLRQARETVLAAHAHQDLPFEQLVQALRPQRNTGHTPLFQAMFVLENAGEHTAALDGLRAQPLDIAAAPVAKFDLTLQVTEQAEGLRSQFEFNADLFDAESVTRWSRHWHTLLQAIAARTDMPIGDLPMLPADERRQVLVEWNRTQALPAQPTIHEMFEACAARHSDRVALAFEDRRITYAALNVRANRLARRLRRDHGVGPDTLVGIFMERAPELVVATLAVLKAGGAYLPLDPSLPGSRLGHMIEDSLPRLLLTRSTLLDRLPGLSTAHLCLDDKALGPYGDSGEGGEDGEGGNLPPIAQSDHLAYVIYTSGSTGRPKGTLLHHRGLVNLAPALHEAFGLHPGMRVLQWASFNFDASVADIFTTLTSGATLHLAPSTTLLAGRELMDILKRHQIELVALTPSTLSTLSQEEPLPDLRTLVVAGERCDRALIAPWLKRHKVINAYGPTEVTVCATVHPCEDDGRNHPPIGLPLANTQVYLLDARLNPVPIGVIGELFVAGEGLARGYLGRPDLTAERFIQDPFCEAPGARMYKTGDLARYRADGRIEYKGRNDEQVKIRGHRIEPAEIEFALASFPAVREAAVLAQLDPQSELRLVAYVVRAPGPEADSAPAALRAALQRMLPAYMVPSRFVFVERIPINSSGKVDRKALEAMQSEGAEETQPQPPAPPATPTEERLTALWCELLGHRQVGRDEDFFELGGHSLMAVRLMARIQETFGTSLPLSQLFQHPNVVLLAAAIDAQRNSADLVVPMAAGPRGTAPVWLIHPAGGTVFCYRKLAARLGGDRPVFAIQSGEIAGRPVRWADFESLCEDYAQEILRTQATGPFHLAGWSMGGAIAFHVAELLEAAGHQVAWVGLFDTLTVQDRSPLDFDEFVAWALHHFEGEASDRNCADIDFMHRQYEIQQRHAGLMASFMPGRIKAPVHAFHAEASPDPAASRVDWLAHTATPGRSTQRTLPGRHENVILLDANVDAIAEVLSLA